jgi:hypothetical protein
LIALRGINPSEQRFFIFSRNKKEYCVFDFNQKSV